MKKLRIFAAVCCIAVPAIAGSVLLGVGCLPASVRGPAGVYCTNKRDVTRMHAVPAGDAHVIRQTCTECRRVETVCVPCTPVPPSLTCTFSCSDTCVDMASFPCWDAHVPFQHAAGNCSVQVANNDRSLDDVYRRVAAVTPPDGLWLWVDSSRTTRCHLARFGAQETAAVVGLVLLLFAGVALLAWAAAWCCKNWGRGCAASPPPPPPLFWHHVTAV